MMQAWGAAFGSSSMGSVSKYCLSHSPVPIIVVRPESKVRKAMAKRRADPKRGKHFAVMPTMSPMSSILTPTQLPSSGTGRKPNIMDLGDFDPLA